MQEVPNGEENRYLTQQNVTGKLVLKWHSVLIKLAIIIVEEMNLFHKQMSVFLRLVCAQNSHGVNFILEESPGGPSSITPTTPHSLSISR